MNRNCRECGKKLSRVLMDLHIDHCNDCCDGHNGTFGFGLAETISGGKPERIRISNGSGLPNFPGEKKRKN